MWLSSKVSILSFLDVEVNNDNNVTCLCQSRVTFAYVLNLKEYIGGLTLETNEL